MVVEKEELKRKGNSTARDVVVLVHSVVLVDIFHFVDLTILVGGVRQQSSCRLS